MNEQEKADRLASEAFDAVLAQHKRPATGKATPWTTLPNNPTICAKLENVGGELKLHVDVWRNIPQ